MRYVKERKLEIWKNDNQQGSNDGWKMIEKCEGQ